MNIDLIIGIVLATGTVLSIAFIALAICLYFYFWKTKERREFEEQIAKKTIKELEEYEQEILSKEKRFKEQIEELKASLQIMEEKYAQAQLEGKVEVAFKWKDMIKTHNEVVEYWEKNVPMIIGRIKDQIALRKVLLDI